MRCCDFCGLNEHQVKKLIAGSKHDHEAHICDGCVRVCGDIITEADKAKVKEA